MGRWRAPQPSASPYITPQGFESLQLELSGLWERRADVVKALAAAAAEGDRSENAEYIYRKKELGGIDRRIRYLQRRMPNLNVVKEFPSGERIFFGASVTLQTGTDKHVEYRIVGPDEADADPKFISIDSPLAKVLLKKSVGDTVKLKHADNNSKYIVMKVSYE